MMAPAGYDNPEFDFENYKPRSLKDKKDYEDARKVAIENEVKLGNLVEKKQVQGVISRYAGLIQTHFVQVPRREAANLAAILSVEGKEKEIERFLSESIESGLNAIREELKSTMRKRTWK
jgi:hypothetical protein